MDTAEKTNYGRIVSRACDLLGLLENQVLETLNRFSELEGEIDESQLDPDEKLRLKIILSKIRDELLTEKYL